MLQGTADMPAGDQDPSRSVPIMPLCPCGLRGPEELVLDAELKGSEVS